MGRGGHHGGGHHGGGHHSGEGGGHRFGDWFYQEFGHDPEIYNHRSEEDYDDWEDRFRDWYSDFMNDFFGSDSGEHEETEGDEGGNAEAQTGDEMSPRTKKIIAASVIASAVALLILAVLIITVVCCCVKKKRKSMPQANAGRPTAPPRPREVVIQRHPKEIEAYALPYPSPMSGLPDVEGTKIPQKMQVEVVQNGLDAPDSNPREYIEVFSPPPAYEPGERY